jgi:hypothetical protein
MRLISRHRQQRRSRQPRIAFSQEEITADLHYPATRRLTAPEAARARGAGR